MFKFIALLAFVSAVLADTSFVSTEKRAVIVPRHGEDVSYAVGSVKAGPTNFYVPPDAGGNFGDNLWRTRVPGDALLIREIQVNDVKNTEQEFKWNASFAGKQITHIRFLNIGRQRAYVESVSSAGGSVASAVVRIAAGQQFRLLIEVYGR